MKILMILILSVPLYAQIRAGCTPMSVDNIMEQALSANGLWEWNCYAQDIGTTNAILSVTGFALDFIQLQQLTPAEVTDIFTQKVKMSGWGRAAQIAGFVGAAALLAGGQGYFVVGQRVASTIGLAAYGASEAQPLFVAQEPSISSAIAGMLTSDQVLTPGQGISFKVFASNTGSPIGPGPLTARASTGRKTKSVRPVGSIGPIILTHVAPSSPTLFAPKTNLSVPPCTSCFTTPVTASLTYTTLSDVNSGWSIAPVEQAAGRVSWEAGIDYVAMVQ